MHILKPLNHWLLFCRQCSDYVNVSTVTGSSKVTIHQLPFIISIREWFELFSPVTNCLGRALQAHTACSAPRRRGSSSPLHRRRPVPSIRTGQATQVLSFLHSSYAGLEESAAREARGVAGAAVEARDLPSRGPPRT